MVPSLDTKYKHRLAWWATLSFLLSDQKDGLDDLEMKTSVRLFRGGGLSTKSPLRTTEATVRVSSFLRLPTNPSLLLHDACERPRGATVTVAVPKTTFTDTCQTPAAYLISLRPVTPGSRGANVSCCRGRLLRQNLVIATPYSVWG